jgi:hypothetical protein
MELLGGIKERVITEEVKDRREEGKRIGKY